MMFSLFSMLSAFVEITNRLFVRPANDGNSDYTEYSFLKSRARELFSEEI